MNLPLHYVISIVVLRDDKILLEHVDNIGWKFPGGHIENNENPIQACEREAREELDISIKFVSKPLFFTSETVHSLPVPFEMFTLTVDKDNNLSEPHTNIGLMYLVTTVDEPKGNEGQKIQWFTEKEIEVTEMSSAVKIICKKAFSMSS